MSRGREIYKRDWEEMIINREVELGRILLEKFRDMRVFRRN